MEVGNNLTFWDIYCFFDISSEIIERINDIPRTNNPHFPVKEPKVLCVEEFEPGNADAPSYPEQSKCFIYKLSRYECGASGFDAIVLRGEEGMQLECLQKPKITLLHLNFLRCI